MTTTHTSPRLVDGEISDREAHCDEAGVNTTEVLAVERSIDGFPMERRR